MNAFNLSNQALTFLWQEMRDSAAWATELAITDEDSKTRLGVAALGNEMAADADKRDNVISLGKLAVDIWHKWATLQGDYEETTP